MMRMKYLFKIVFVFTALMLSVQMITSCATDELPDPLVPTYCDSISATYVDTVKSIIDLKCGGCHNNGTTPSMLNFMEVFGNKERIANRALDLKTMPPSYAPLQLTEEELRILGCWRTAGFPEN